MITFCTPGSEAVSEQLLGSNRLPVCDGVRLLVLPRLDGQPLKAR